MASLKERLKDKCICGHQGEKHAAHDCGTHIGLGRCCEQGCTCGQFRRVQAGFSGSGKRNRRAHGIYSKSSFRS
jgi:hypothetical protein